MLHTLRPTPRRSTLLGLALALGAACAKNASEVAPANAAPPSAKKEAPAADDQTPPPGVDLSKLDEFERKVFFRVANKEPSACGKAHSLLYSARNDRACKKSLYAVKYVVRLVDSGYTDSEISESLKKRYAAGPPRKIDVAEAPCKGNSGARITLVEFVDYECPHCRRVQPVLRQVLDEFRDEVRICFKHFPLGAHATSRLAAEAAVAAHKQGKFWPYNEKIWDHADTLTPALLETLAKECGLDVAKWRADSDSTEIKQRVQRDRTEGDVLGIEATPSIYLNGRTYTDHREIDSLRDWINEELGH